MNESEKQSLDGEGYLLLENFMSEELVEAVRRVGCDGAVGRRGLAVADAVEVPLEIVAGDGHGGSARIVHLP